MVHICNSTIQEAEEGRPWVQNQLGYRARPSANNKKYKTPKDPKANKNNKNKEYAKIKISSNRS